MKHLEIENLFESANLTGLFESTSELFETKLTHKAKIEIDEEGSILPTPISRLHSELLIKFPAFRFYFNEPFLFLIHDEQSNEILFAGIYQGPKN